MNPEPIQPGKVEQNFNMIARDLDRAFALAQLTGVETLILQHARERSYTDAILYDSAGKAKLPPARPFNLDLKAIADDLGGLYALDVARKGLKSLVAKNILQVRDDGRLWINKDYRTWVKFVGKDKEPAPALNPAQVERAYAATRLGADLKVVSHRSHTHRSHREGRPTKRSEIPTKKSAEPTKKSGNPDQKVGTADQKVAGSDQIVGISDQIVGPPYRNAGAGLELENTESNTKTPLPPATGGDDRGMSSATRQNTELVEHARVTVARQVVAATTDARRPGGDRVLADTCYEAVLGFILEGYSPQDVIGAYASMKDLPPKHWTKAVATNLANTAKKRHNNAEAEKLAASQGRTLPREVPTLELYPLHVADPEARARLRAHYPGGGR